MELEPSDELLADEPLNKLAEQALCAVHATAAETAQAWVALDPQISIICACVCRGQNRGHRQEVSQETKLRILQSRGGPSGYKSGHNFRPWCSSIAHHCLFDIFRKKKRDKKNFPPNMDDQIPEVAEPMVWVAILDKLLDLAAPFPQDDVAIAQEFYDRSSKVAVQIFAVSWLWCKLPDAVWRGWLEGVEIAPPWPSEQILFKADPRATILIETAEKFDSTPDAVRKNVERNRHELLRLRSVQELLVGGD